MEQKSMKDYSVFARVKIKEFDRLSQKEQRIKEFLLRNSLIIFLK